MIYFEPVHFMKYVFPMIMAGILICGVLVWSAIVAFIIALRDYSAKEMDKLYTTSLLIAKTMYVAIWTLVSFYFAIQGKLNVWVLFCMIVFVIDMAIYDYNRRKSPILELTLSKGVVFLCVLLNIVGGFSVVINTIQMFM